MSLDQHSKSGLNTPPDLAFMPNKVIMDILEEARDLIDKENESISEPCEQIRSATGKHVINRLEEDKENSFNKSFKRRHSESFNDITNTRYDINSFKINDNSLTVASGEYIELNDENNNIYRCKKLKLKKTSTDISGKDADEQEVIVFLSELQQLKKGGVGLSSMIPNDMSLNLTCESDDPYDQKLNAVNPPLETFTTKNETSLSRTPTQQQIHSFNTQSTPKPEYNLDLNNNNTVYYKDELGIMICKSIPPPPPPPVNAANEPKSTEGQTTNPGESNAVNDLNTGSNNVTNEVDSVNNREEAKNESDKENSFLDDSFSQENDENDVEKTTEQIMKEINDLNEKQPKLTVFVYAVNAAMIIFTKAELKDGIFVETGKKTRSKLRKPLDERKTQILKDAIANRFEYNEFELEKEWSILRSNLNKKINTLTKPKLQNKIKLNIKKEKVSK